MSDLDPDDPRVKTAVFGKQVEDWLHTEVARFVIERAEGLLEQAIEELKGADPANATGIIRLQERIRMLEAFELWLMGAVQDGHTAIEQIDSQEE